MNREHKYKAIRLDNGEWVYGDLIHTTTCLNGVETNHTQVGVDMDFHEVDPETVGQYTGLKDKNGVEIYEGDILRPDKWSWDWVVQFDNTKARFNCIVNSHGHCNDYIPTALVKVIGNIHDKPEMK